MAHGSFESRSGQTALPLKEETSSSAIACSKGPDAHQNAFRLVIN